MGDDIRIGLSRRSRASVVAAVTVIAAVGCLTRARAARAEDATDAEALIRQGVDLRAQGKDERALPMFQKAYGLTRTPRTAGQLGLGEMALGYWLEAEGHLSEAMEAPSHPWVAKNRSALVAALGELRQKIGQVTVTGRPAGAEVRLNHRLVGTLPLPAPVRMGEGRIDVQLTAPGYRAWSKMISLGGGGKQEVVATLERDEARAGAEVVAAAPRQPPQGAAGEVSGASATGTAPIGHATTTTAVESSAAPPASPSASAGDGHRTLAYVGAGLALVTLVFAGVETARWQGKQRDFDNHLGPGPGGDPTMSALFKHDCGAGDPMRGGAGCQDLYDSAQRARTFAVVGYVVGAALAGGAAALFFTTTTRDRDGSHAQAAGCFPDPLSRGAGCRWTF